MNNKINKLAVLIGLMLAVSISISAQTSVFTYQGRFTDTNVPQPTSGTYNMQFALYDAVSAGNQVGTTQTNMGVQVSSGIFSVSLDFGAASFTGANRFLEIRVYDTATTSYITLTPRQQITSAPYAVRTVAASLADGLSVACIGCVSSSNLASASVVNSTLSANSVTTSKVVDGTITTGKLTDNSVTSFKIVDGTITNSDISDTAAIAGTKISGNTITNLNASNLGTGTVPDARLSTNITAQGNTFNGANQLVRLDGTGKLPAIDGSQLTNITSSGLTGTGTVNFHPKFTGASTLGNSLIQDNGTGLGVNTAPDVRYLGYFNRTQLTATGDGQATIFGYRTRDTQNDGTNYGQTATNSGVNGFNFWGDLYTFGVVGHSYNDYSRTGGVLGAEVAGTYWGSLGYRSSALTNFGVYGSSAQGTGTGLTSDKQGIGGGFYGGLIGSWSRGEVMGSISTGEMFASYNLGNVYTSGFTADLVSVSNNASDARVAAYANTSTELKVYDNGSAKLSGDSVFVPFTDAYRAMLAAAPNVTVTAVGSPAQLYIKSIETNGFTVAVASGTADVTFSWIAVGSRVDASKAKALPAEIVNGTFDTQLKDAMFNENDKENSGKPLWWDGNKLRFDKAPEPQNAREKVEPNPKDQ